MTKLDHFVVFCRVVHSNYWGGNFQFDICRSVCLIASGINHSRENCSNPQSVTDTGKLFAPSKQEWIQISTCRLSVRVRRTIYHGQLWTVWSVSRVYLTKNTHFQVRLVNHLVRVSSGKFILKKWARLSLRWYETKKFVCQIRPMKRHIWGYVAFRRGVFRPNQMAFFKVILSDPSNLP